MDGGSDRWELPTPVGRPKKSLSKLVAPLMLTVMEVRLAEPSV